MARQIFVNLPIKDMERSKAFFGALGFTFNPQFTNEQGACMVVAEDICVMLLVEPFFQGFTAKKVADAHEVAEVLVCLSCDSRAEVDVLPRGSVRVNRTVAHRARRPQRRFSGSRRTGDPRSQLATLCLEHLGLLCAKLGEQLVVCREFALPA